MSLLIKQYLIHWIQLQDPYNAQEKRKTEREREREILNYLEETVLNEKIDFIYNCNFAYSLNF